MHGLQYNVNQRKTINQVEKIQFKITILAPSQNKSSIGKHISVLEALIKSITPQNKAEHLGYI